MLLGALLAVLSAGPLRAEEVLVFAAASLSDALGELGKAYEASAGPRIVLNLGASNGLARQIEAGAPADVFFSADPVQMDRLQGAGLVEAGERVDALSNVLVVVVPAASPKSPRDPSDLVSMKRIALADPEAVPAGVYARRYLVSKGRWESLRDRILPALDVRAALAAVESENADAGIVYRTDAALSGRVRVAFEIPREEGPRIAYVLAPLASSKKRATRDFVRYLQSPAAISVYRRYGFLVTLGK